MQALTLCADQIGLRDIEPTASSVLASSMTRGGNVMVLMASKTKRSASFALTDGVLHLRQT